MVCETGIEDPVSPGIAFSDTCKLAGSTGAWSTPVMVTVNVSVEPLAASSSWIV